MKLLNHAISTCIVISSISLSLTANAFAKNLTAAEIKSNIAGKRVSWVTNDGYKGTTKYSKNGTAKVSIKSPKKFQDQGKWRTKGNKICNKWEQIREGKEKCFTLKYTDKKGVFTSDAAVWTVR